MISEPISSGREWVDWEQMEHKVVFSICSQTTIFRLFFVRIHFRWDPKCCVKWSSVCHTEGTRQLITTLMSVFNEACSASHWANSSCHWVGGLYQCLGLDTPSAPTKQSRYQPCVRVYKFSCRGVQLQFLQISSTVCMINNTLHPSACFLIRCLADARQLSENRPCVKGIISLI